MKYFKLPFLLLSVAYAGSTMLARPAVAATVYARVVNCPHSAYTAYLFRTGDPWPTQVISGSAIYGGAYFSFGGISRGRWFIRVVNQYDGYTTQTNDGFLFSYYSTPLFVGTLSMAE